jgi:hypothetical protein
MMVSTYDGECAALSLLADGRADVDEVVDISRGGWWIGAVQISLRTHQYLHHYSGTGGSVRDPTRW